MKKHLATMFALLSALCFTQAFGEGFTVISSDEAAALGGATGGDEVRQIDNGNGTLDLIHIFNSSGSLTIPTKNKIAADSPRALVVGGGGSGSANCGGGGGAGEYVSLPSLSLAAGTATITVGNGGAAVAVGGGAGKSGEPSSLTLGGITYTALGGGGGGTWNGTASSGGSGGGSGSGNGSATLTGAASTATLGQGSAGGNGFNGSGSPAGGGGGAGGAGGNAAADTPGAGGAGIKNDISGDTEAWYAAGGGGGGANNSEPSGQSAGGSGIGGSGSSHKTQVATAGAANTGSGGGGGAGGYNVDSTPSGAGGSGVVIIRYTVPKPKESQVKPLVDAGLITFDGAEVSYVDGDLLLQYKGTTGSLVLPSYAKAWILSVGGGGAGGSAVNNSTSNGAGGGGGAGQVVNKEDQLLLGGTYSITVGAGGEPAAKSTASPGGDGQTSKIEMNGTELTVYTAVGGGGGGGEGPGQDGASGGGGSMTGGAAADGGVATSGNQGGRGAHNKAGGGGGGAGAVGNPTSAAGRAGRGGDGVTSMIAVDAGDDPVYYAGGGGGGTLATNYVGGGGKGGGGSGGGGSGGTAKIAQSGEANTGSGGGGGSHAQAGGAGGSGIVIIRISEALAGDPIKPATTNWVYTGKEQVLVPESLAYTVEGQGAGTDAGTYHVKVTLKDGFKWSGAAEGHEYDVAEFNWTISPKPIDKPTAPEDLVFNKGNQLALPTPDAALVFAEGSVTNATNAGTYSYTVTLKDNNYVWKGAAEGQERDPETVTWKIASQRVAVPPVSTPLVYTGEYQTPMDISLIDEEICEFYEEEGYSSSEREAGDYTLCLTLKNTETVKNYVWYVDETETYVDQEREWKIAQAANAVSDLTITGWMKGNPPNKPTATATFGAATIVYSYASKEDADETDWSTTVPTEAGTWWVRATVAETTNWAAAEAKMEFEIYGDPSEIYEYSTEFTLGTFTGTVADMQVPIAVSEELVRGFRYDQVEDQKLMAFTQDGIVLPFEVSGWNPGGETIFWVRVSELKTGATIKMWWRVKSGKVPLPNDTAAVWKDYVGVWHMDETITADNAATTLSKDATGNALHAKPTKGSATTADLKQMVSIEGVIGHARVNSSVTSVTRGNRLLTARPLSDVGSTFVFSGWFRMNASGGYPRLVGNKVGNAGNGWSIEMANNTTGIINRFSGPDGNRYTIQNVGNLLNNWSYMTFAYAGTNAYVYCDGQLKWTKPAGEIQVVDNPSGALAFGSNSDGSEYSLNGAYDELRLYKGTTTAERVLAEYEIGQQASATTVGPVYHGSQIVDAWLTKPSITPLSWERTDDPASIVTVTDGTLASGRPVQHTFFYVNEMTNRFSEISKLTKPGLVRALFAPTDDASYEPLSEQLEVRIFAPQNYADLGGSAEGRVLLMNNDGGDATHPAVDYQGWYDRVNRSETLLTRATFWEYTGTNENDLVDKTYNRQGGTSWILWTANRERRLWTLENCRHGNTFAAGDSTSAGQTPSSLAATQNYLPWSRTSRRITAHNTYASQAQHVGQLLMQNTTNAVVYSTLYTNGVGTIYFDAVNGWTRDAVDGAGNPYDLVVEVATKTLDGDSLNEENGSSIRPDGTVDVFGNVQWELATQYPVRVSASGELSRPTGVLTNHLAVTTGGAMTEFYRVYVPVNAERARFRIKRVSKYNNPGSTAEVPDTAYILLDNILVSYPAMSADLMPTGVDTTKDDEKQGAFTLGQELATTVPFPAAGDANVFGRAAPIYHTNTAIAAPDTNAFVMAAKMHYRWRYLNQGTLTPWEDAPTVDLDVMNGFKSVTPLEIPDAVGDVEFWFDAYLQAPFFKYVDYSGSGVGLPKEIYTEEISAVTNTYAKVNGSTNVLASAGNDWFFRLRNGASDWESLKVRIFGGTALDGDYPMELLGNDMWRALVKIPVDAKGVAGFNIIGINQVAPGATTLPDTAQFFGDAVAATNAIPSDGTLVPDGAAQRFVIDHNANYLEFKASTKFNTWSVSRAERQNFNDWNDLFGPNFLASRKTNDVDNIAMKTMNLDASEWKFFASTDESWNEPFYLANYMDPGYPKDELFNDHTTPKDWNAKNVTFVSTALTAWNGDVTEREKDEKLNSGIAAKLLGQGKGTLEFTKSFAPKGLDTVTVSARIGQSMTFDSFSFNPAAYAKKNYTFIAPAKMSSAITDNNADGNMTVGGSVSVVGYYRATKGCYEFRIERRFKGGNIRLLLYKWEFRNNALQPRLLCGQDFSKQYLWTNGDASKFYGLLLSLKTTSAGTEIIGGFTGLADEINDTGKNSHTIYSKAYGGLRYVDKENPLTSGAYGVGSKDCPAEFLMPFHYDAAITDAPLSKTVTDGGDAALGSGGKFFNPSGATNTWTLPESFTREFWWDSNTNTGVLPEEWELVPGRCIGEKYNNSHPAWYVLRAPSEKQTLDLYLQPKTGGAWTKAGKPIEVSGYAFATKEIPLHRTGEWNLQLRTGSGAEDVVVKSVTQTQWQAPDHENIEYLPDNFVYTQGIIATNTTEKLNTVTLQPSRGLVSQPFSVRGPILGGLGKIAFSYRDVDEHAELWVQMATNRVTASTLTGRTGYNQSVTSVEPPTQEPQGSWVTVKKYTAGELGKSGSKTVYIGLHNQEEAPLDGVFRLFIPTNVVREAGIVATNATANVNYGKLTITRVTVTDEPGLSDRSWYAYNARTIGDATDSESRMYLSDTKLPNDAGSGLDVALNNSLRDVPADDVVRAQANVPSIVSPTFKGGDSGVGSVTFKARLYSTTGIPETANAGRIIVYGTDNSATGTWTPLATNEVTSSVFRDFTWETRGKTYKAIRLGIESPAVVSGDPRDIDCDRVILDEIVIGERIRPTINFLYARPFRQNLMSTEPIADIMSANEQPLAGESWGVQTQLSLKQLTDEIDKERGFEVYLSYYTGNMWGYEKWRNDPAAVKMIPLKVAGDPTDLIFRSVGETPESLVKPSGAGGVTVQFQLTVRYYDRNGNPDEKTIETYDDWRQPDWFWPVDKNVENGGDVLPSKFSPYTIIDTVSPGRAWINEVNYNDGEATEMGGYQNQTNQFIEICVPSGVDMSNWRVRVTDTNLKQSDIALFGYQVPATKTSKNMTNGFEFVVLESPLSHNAGGVIGLDGKPAADGTWAMDSAASLSEGTFNYGSPYQIELVRPSGIVEHQFVLMGTNTWRFLPAIGYSYEGTNLLAKLNAANPSPKRFYAGEDTRLKLDGKGLGSIGVIGGKSDGEPAPGADGTWVNQMRFTPGSLNEGQVIPADWFVAPNGTNCWVTLRVDGANLCQNLNGETNAVMTLVMPQGSTTNITYTAKPWYELASLTVGGETVAEHEARFGNAFVYALTPTGQTCQVVATEGYDKGILDFTGMEGPYAPSIVRWLSDLTSTVWPGKTAEDIRLGWWKQIGGDEPEQQMTLEEMYWLDVPPFNAADAEKAWWVRAGITRIQPSAYHRTIKYLDGSTETLDNLSVDFKLYVSNALNAAEVAAPKRMQGLDYEQSDAKTGPWKGETLQIRGNLIGAEVKDFKQGIMPFRLFVLDAGSFDPATYTSTIEIFDPYSSYSPGYGYGWSKWKGKTTPVFDWALTSTNAVPLSVETLKKLDTYEW